MDTDAADALYSNVTTKKEADARGLIYNYFKTWRPSHEYIMKMIQALPRDKLEELVNDSELKLLNGLNKDEKIVLE